MMKRFFVFTLSISFLYTTSFAQDSQSSGDLFLAKVQPIFETYCLQCHNSEFNQGGLDISSAASFFKGGLRGESVIKGKPAESTLLQMIKHEAEPYMPFGMEKLSDEEIQSIEKWITSGAEWTAGQKISNDPKQHWAYQTVIKPALPEVKDTDWVRNPIDVFIQSKLNEIGLLTSPEASRETLIRRLSLDLTGLPPDPVDVDRFLKDDSPDAYENLVNRLLSSPHFGERWAAHWLDLARYADSNGFEKDDQREMWPYRDWVINALNVDMPFDQFTIEQIAGDLLPGSTLNQKIATGYHRNTMINEEGGVNQEEYRVAAVIDRVNTTAAVWLGTTLACAQCHDHKFDPISQKEYFQFYAFFNNTHEEVKQYESFSAQSDGPLVKVPNAEQQKILDKITPKIERLKAKLERQTPALDNAQAKWEKQTLDEAIHWTVIKPNQVTSEKETTFEIQDDGAVLALGENPITDSYQVELDFKDMPVTGIRLELLQDESLPESGPGRRSQGRFTLTDIKLAVIKDKIDSAIEIDLINPTADWGGHAISSTIDDDGKSGWGNGRDNQRPFEAVYQTPNLGLISHAVKYVLNIKTEQGTGENIGKFRVSITTDDDPIANAIPDDVYAILLIPSTNRTEDQQEKLSRYFHSVSPILDPVRDEMAKLEAQLPKNLPTVLVMREMEKPRQTHIFKGGSFSNPGEPVKPNIPSVLSNNSDDEQKWSTRLDLARWIVDESNPLTARVYVNRVWEQIFGYGIIETTEDFGTRSPEPSNQELLDWLAYAFMDNHWSMKSLIFTIVTSSAYRQDSSISPQKLEADPKNRYVSRGPAFRLRAEFIRDNGLKISGLLNPEMGGPSVFPHQPEGVWNMPYSSAKWVTSENGNQYRRGLYTHWQRTATYPTFVNFDAPSRETVCTQRIRTNTPLQALNLLNDPAFFDMAKGLAYRMIDEMDGEISDRLQYGFRICTSRFPSQKELKSLYTYYDKQLDYFKEKPEEAANVIRNIPVIESLPKEEIAAIVMASNVLLNIDETISKR